MPMGAPGARQAISFLQTGAHFMSRADTLSRVSMHPSHWGPQALRWQASTAENSARERRSAMQRVSQGSPPCPRTH